MKQVLFYKSALNGGLWDTWLFQNQNRYYLFYLVGSGGKHFGIAMGASIDGVCWEEMGIVIEREEGLTSLGTGSIWKAPSKEEKDLFIMNFSKWKGETQTIFFAESTDLIQWRELGGEFEFRPDQRWYVASGGLAGRWDCIYSLDKPGGGRHGWWTANPTGFLGFGFGETEDGISWRSLPPPLISWGDTPPMTSIEFGAMARVNGKYYAMLGCCSSGMYTFVADDVNGPFTPAPINYALLTSPLGRWPNTYFARFFQTEKALLVNHHAISSSPEYEVYFAPLKEAEIDSEGVFRLKWWPGNLAGLKTTRSLGDCCIRSEGACQIPYHPSAGALIGAEISSNGFRDSALPTITVGHLSKRTSSRMTLYPTGAICLELEVDGKIQWLEHIDRNLKISSSPTIRLLLMHSFVELYVDDYLIQVHSLHDAPGGTVTLRGMEPVVYLTTSLEPSPSTGR